MQPAVDDLDERPDILREFRRRRRIMLAFVLASWLLTSFFWTDEVANGRPPHGRLVQPDVPVVRPDDAEPNTTLVEFFSQRYEKVP